MAPLACALALLFCTAVLAGYAVRVARLGRPTMPRLGASPGSPLLPGWIVEAFYWSFHVPARVLARWRVNPDTLTYLSLALSLGSLPLVAAGSFALAAALITAGAVLDALDGMVARARGVASARGAVLDACTDRLSDAAPLAGLALYYRGSAAALGVTLAAMVASSLVSYARAKADIYGLSLPNGVMRRHERVALLVTALVVGPLMPAVAPLGAIPRPLTLGGVALIAALGLAAAALLVRRTRAALDPARGHAPPRPAGRSPAGPHSPRAARDGKSADPPGHTALPGDTSLPAPRSRLPRAM